jgi:hypothetical protein
MAEVACVRANKTEESREAARSEHDNGAALQVGSRNPRMVAMTVHDEREVVPRKNAKQSISIVENILRRVAREVVQERMVVEDSNAGHGGCGQGVQVGVERVESLLAEGPTFGRVDVVVVGRRVQDNKLRCGRGNAHESCLPELVAEGLVGTWEVRAEAGRQPEWIGAVLVA